MNNKIKHESAWATDTGTVREHNEDMIAVHETTEAHSGDGDALSFYVLSDGAGGMPRGELASQLTTEAVVDYLEGKLQQPSNLRDDVLQEWLDVAFHEANRLVRVQQQKTNSRFIATLLASIVSGGETMIGNVGDSRAYVIRGQEMVQITKDHSFSGELLRHGLITEEEERHHNQRHLLVRAIGIGDDVKGEFFHVSFEPGHYLLLCSDGLTNDLTNAEICTIVHEAESVRDACQTLIEAAKDVSGQDNISVVLIHFTER